MGHLEICSVWVLIVLVPLVFANRMASVHRKNSRNRSAVQLCLSWRRLSNMHSCPSQVQPSKFCLTSAGTCRDISSHADYHAGWCSRHGAPCLFNQKRSKKNEKEMFTRKRKGEAYPVWIFGTSFLESQILFHLISMAQPALESRRFPTLERIHRLRAWHVAAGVMFFLVQNWGEAWRSPTSTYTCTYKDI